jgi:glucuronate isomerase
MMTKPLRNAIFDEIDQIPLIDPHTHINPHRPAAATLADLLGYHYYTELVHSAGLSRDHIEQPDLNPADRVARLVSGLPAIENTVQYQWLIEICQQFFGFEDDRITTRNWRDLYDRAAAKMQQSDWALQVRQACKLEALFLTNDFDDPLEGFDNTVYVPCLRTDDLVFHLARPVVQERLQRATGQEIRGSATLTAAIGRLFEHFVRRRARACAISLPPDFVPCRVSAEEAEKPLQNLLRQQTNVDPGEARLVGRFVFWTLADCCSQFRLPFDLMIGVNRAVYPAGVYQGQDLFDSRVSLIQYRELFNAFPTVTFPISVLASVTNQELVAYSWIFPNVVASGHWWYSNIPAYIEHDLAARLEAVPQTKQIGYYSDMYKLEFALPKFAMYKRVLAKVLAERFVIDRGWSEEQAIALARRILRENVERIFPPRSA